MFLRCCFVDYYFSFFNSLFASVYFVFSLFVPKPIQMLFSMIQLRHAAGTTSD